MRVLVLSQYYTPEPVPKPADLSRELTQHGHRVSVLTGFPNYPKGQLYPGFRLHPISHETIEGIDVIRAFEFPYHGQRAAGRIVNYLSFMLSAPLGSFFVPACDVMYVWHPPLTIGVAAWLIARLRRIPFVYDVQDIWPESAVLSGILKDGRLVRMMAKLERFVYHRADHLLVVTEGARQNLISKGVPPDKVSVMPHWVDESLFSCVSPEDVQKIRAQYGWGSRFVLLFAGNIGLVQGLHSVIQAAANLNPDSDILIVLVGDGTDKPRLQAQVSSLHLEERVQFVDWQPMEKIPAFMAAADVLLVHLKRSELSKFVIPSKTLACLAAGKPILMAMDGAAADLVQDAEAGIVVAPEDAKALADAIQTIYRLSAQERVTMGSNGRAYLLSHLSKTNVIARYERLLQTIVEQKNAQRIAL